MTPRQLNERGKYLFRTYAPELPEPIPVCSWVYTRTLEDGRHEFRCGQCGEVQVRDELIGCRKEQVCRA